jgi:hypothetical protein
MPMSFKAIRSTLTFLRSSAQFDPEDLHELIWQYRGAYQRSVEHYGRFARALSRYLDIFLLRIAAQARKPAKINDCQEKRPVAAKDRNTHIAIGLTAIQHRHQCFQHLPIVGITNFGAIESSRRNPPRHLREKGVLHQSLP